MRITESQLRKIVKRMINEQDTGYHGMSPAHRLAGPAPRVRKPTSKPLTAADAEAIRRHNESLGEVPMSAALRQKLASKLTHDFKTGSFSTAMELRALGLSDYEASSVIDDISDDYGISSAST